MAGPREAEISLEDLAMGTQISIRGQTEVRVLFLFSLELTLCDAHSHGPV